MKSEISGIRTYWSKLWKETKFGLDPSDICTRFKFNFFLKDILNDLPVGAKILEVGCGNCQWLFLIKAYRPDLVLHGFDCIPEVVELAKNNGIDAYEGDARKLPFDDGQFEFVFSWGVVEHVNETDVAISEHYRVSSNYVVIDVPNFTSLPGYAKRRTIRRRGMSAFDAQMEFGKMYRPKDFERMVNDITQGKWSTKFLCNYMTLPAKVRYFEPLVYPKLRKRFGQNIGVISSSKS